MILLDTYIWLWAVQDDPRLGSKLRQSILAQPPVLSTASLWEVTLKAGKGKLDVDVTRLHDNTRAAGVEFLPILAEHVLAMARLPDHHADPFDRILLAQARVEGLKFATADRALRAYSAQVNLVFP